MASEKEQEGGQGESTGGKGGWCAMPYRAIDRGRSYERKTFRARSFPVGQNFQIGIFDWWKILGRHLSSSGIVTSLFGKIKSWKIGRG